MWPGWTFKDGTLWDPKGRPYSEQDILRIHLLTTRQVCEALNLTPKALSVLKIRSRAAGYKGKFPKEAQPDHWEIEQIAAYKRQKEARRNV